MQRDLHQLSERKFDVLIVGGGIQGSAIAWEASRRGLRTALIEKGDFGHATSANSLKIIHGGLRYLQTLDVSRMRASIRARNQFMQLAPHLVEPLACAIPTFGNGLRGKQAMRLALIANDVISWDRNRGLEECKRLPRGEILARNAYAAVLRSSLERNITGGALWYDGLAVNTERLLLAFLEAAHTQGACVANYLEVTELGIQEKRISGVQATDRISGDAIFIHASTVVNAAGPWIETVLPFSMARNPTPRAWALGLNLVTRKRVVEHTAIGLEGHSSNPSDKSMLKGGKRLFFFVPWRGYTMIGTSYRCHEGPPDELNVSRRDIEAFLDDINAVHPGAQLSFGDITFFHAGLLPAIAVRDGDARDVQLESDLEIIDHAAGGQVSGLLTVKTVKYTTAPYVAGLVLDRLPFPAKPAAGSGAKGLNGARDGCRPLAPLDLPSMRIQPETFSAVDHLKIHYGPGYEKILPFLSDGAAGDRLVSANPPVLAAEVVYALRHEMALKLADIVFRRTGLGTAACPSRSTLEEVAALIGRELGWDDARRQQEVEEVLKCYAPLGGPPN
jgi:glycerol-3-phosphate dehydrogenase